MDGWIIGLVGGGVLLVVLVVLLGVVVKAATTTAQTAQAVLVALEDVKSSTAPLSKLAQVDPATIGSGVSTAGDGTEHREGEQG